MPLVTPPRQSAVSARREPELCSKAYGLLRQARLAFSLFCRRPNPQKPASPLGFRLRLREHHVARNLLEREKRHALESTHAGADVDMVHFEPALGRIVSGDLTPTKSATLSRR